MAKKKRKIRELMYNSGQVVNISQNLEWVMEGYSDKFNKLPKADRYRAIRGLWDATDIVYPLTIDKKKLKKMG